MVPSSNSRYIIKKLPQSSYNKITKFIYLWSNSNVRKNNNYFPGYIPWIERNFIFYILRTASGWIDVLDIKISDNLQRKISDYRVIINLITKCVVGFSKKKKLKIILNKTRKINSDYNGCMMVTLWWLMTYKNSEKYYNTQMMLQ